MSATIGTGEGTEGKFQCQKCGLKWIAALPPMGKKTPKCPVCKHQGRKSRGWLVAVLLLG